MSDLLRIVVVLLLVLGNAIFVAAEYALVTARRNRLEELADAGRHGAKHALELMDDPVRFISTVQVGITVPASRPARSASRCPGLLRRRPVRHSRSDLVLLPDLPERRPRGARPEGDSAAAGRADGHRPRLAHRPPRPDRAPRSSGCSRPRRTPSSRLFGIRPAPAGVWSTRGTTSARSSPRRRERRRRRRRARGVVPGLQVRGQGGPRRDGPRGRRSWRSRSTFPPRSAWPPW